MNWVSKLWEGVFTGTPLSLYPYPRVIEAYHRSKERENTK